MRHRWLLPTTLLASCAFDPLSGQRLCEEVGFGIASRIHTCTGDEDLAQVGYERLFETHTCTIAEIEDLGEDPGARYDWFACPAAMLTPECDVLRPEDPGWWLSLHPDCVFLFEPLADIPDTTGPPDTDDTCTSTQDDPGAAAGSCGNPLEVRFDSDSARFTTQEVIQLAGPDEPCVDACGTETRTDLVIRIWVDVASSIQLTADLAPADHLVTVFAPQTTCDDNPQVCYREPESVQVDFATAGYAQVVYQTESSSDEVFSISLTQTPRE